MTWSASALTSASSDSEPTIVITFDSAKYIFNLGENTNRAFLQSTLNAKRTRALFLSSVGSRRATGLASMLMNLCDSGISDLHVVGPPGLVHSLASMRHYVTRDELSLTSREVPILSIPSPLSSASEDAPDTVYKDDNVTIYAFPIIPSKDNSSPVQSNNVMDVDTSDAIPTNAANAKRKRSPSPATRQSKRPSFSDNNGASVPCTDNMSRTQLLEILASSSQNFFPAELEGASADEWRRLLVDASFALEKKAALAGDGQQQEGNKSKGGGQKQKKKQQQPKKIVPAGTPRKRSELASTVTRSQAFRRVLPKWIAPYAPASRPVQHPDDVPTLAYVIVGPRVRGKFNVAQATALGVPKGPMWAQLTRGQSVTVTVDDGQGNKVERVVKPEDCVSKSEGAGVVLILDCPTVSHIDSLASSFEQSAFFSKFQSPAGVYDESGVVRTVFHLCGDDVLETDTYKRFMAKFGLDVHHVVSSRAHCADKLNFTSPGYNQLCLNQLDQTVFPIPHFSVQPLRTLKGVPDLPEKTTPLQANVIVDIHPPRAPAYSTPVHDRFHDAAITEAPLVLDGSLQQCFQEAKALIESAPPRSPAPGDDVQVIPLGTGSALPMKYRNVSGMLLRVPNHGSILLDCGEGTWGQIARNFGTDHTKANNAWDVLRDIKCIFLSHAHADHHIGIIKLLAMRRQLNPPPSEPLYLVANRPILLYLHEWSDIEDLGLRDLTARGVRPIFSENILAGNEDAFRREYWIRTRPEYTQELHRALGLRELRTAEMRHRAKCYGAVIEHQDGWVIAYSGDTMPTDSIVKAAPNATLLIHEATMADDQAELARIKAHSTFSGAVGIGHKMNAKHLLLTHFSARYFKLPPSAMQDSADDIGEENVTSNQEQQPPKHKMSIVMAFDHANMTIGNMWKMNVYMPAIEHNYGYVVGGDEESDVGETSLD